MALLESSKADRARVLQFVKQRRQRIREQDDPALKERAAHCTSRNYRPRDVILLKEIFDLYDKNGDGLLQPQELRGALEVQKAKEQRAARDSLHSGTKCTLEDRQRAAGIVKGVRLDQRKNAEGVFLVSMSSQLFSAMDLDGSGTVSFRELLRICYPTAAKFEHDEMLSWLPQRGRQPRQAAPLASFSTEEGPRLSASAAAEIAALFQLYDTERDGALTKSTLHSAIRSCGLSRSEEEQLFETFDSNGDGLLDLVEFTAMLASTGAFDDRNLHGKDALAPFLGVQ